MSTKLTLRNGVIAAIGISALTLSACASNDGGRYADIYDYEGIGSHGYATTGSYPSAPAVTPGYGSAPVYADCSQITSMPCGSAPVYTPPPAPTYSSCGQMSMGCGSAPVYAQPDPGWQSAPAQPYVEPAPTYTPPAPTYSTGEMADCPSGTTPQADGTCMQGGSSTSYYEPAAPTYTAPTYTAPTTTYSGETANCPSGTTPQSDGTCMQTGSSYTPTTTYSTSTPVVATVCPSGSTMQADGSCMQSHGGYTTSGTYTTTDYLPIRK